LTAAEDPSDVVQAGAEEPLERLDSGSAKVQDLLVDGYRQRRVSVAEQVHRASRRHVAFSEDRREGAPERVRRQSSDRRPARLNEQLVGTRPDRVDHVTANVVGRVSGAVARRKDGIAKVMWVLGAVLEQDLSQCSNLATGVPMLALAARCSSSRTLRTRAATSDVAVLQALPEVGNACTRSAVRSVVDLGDRHAQEHADDQADAACGHTAQVPAWAAACAACSPAVVAALVASMPVVVTT
jgi:hypothetical protein